MARRKVMVAMGAFGLLATGVILINYQASAEPGGQTLLLAHRGISQTFPSEGVTNNTCTAKIIHQPTHPYLENTIASIREAIRAGADRIEIDVHPTTDGKFAVFHDYTLGCRTNGVGKTRDHSMAYLKSLDIGYGYTADGGKTYPFRDKHIGEMPSLDEVVAAFPTRRLLINIKSNEKREGEKLASWLNRLPPQQRSLMMVYGGGRDAMRAVQDNAPDVLVSDKGVVKGCMLPYLALGWSGYVPAGCHNTVVPVPVNYAWLAWGWPYRFSARMRAANSVVWVVGPYRGGTRPSGGVDTEKDFARVPTGFDGEVMTNEIAVIGPLAKARRTRH